MSYYPESIARCQHIKVNGTQCGSPALKRNKFCFFHKRWRDTRIVISKAARRSRASLDLPVLEDANSVQVALMQVMRLTCAIRSIPKSPASSSMDCKQHLAICATQISSHAATMKS